VFTWSIANMPIIDLHFLCHKLALDTKKRRHSPKEGGNSAPKKRILNSRNTKIVGGKPHKGNPILNVVS